MDSDLECRLKEEFGSFATPEFINLIRAAIAAHEDAFKGYIPKEKFMDFLSNVWEGGVNQKKVHYLEVEGSILTGRGLTLNLGSYLEMQGKREGYISGRED